MSTDQPTEAMPFTPEQPFQITEDNKAVLCRKSLCLGGRSKTIIKAIDVELKLNTYADGDELDRPELRADLARAICDFLNERYPVKKD